MGLRIVFFGTPEFAATVLRGLLASSHETIAVAAALDRPSGRGRKVRAGPVSALAREKGLRLLQPESLRAADTQAELRALDADAFVVASYGLIFPSKALAIPRRGAINAHASLLPQLRGAAPVERAILAGLVETGVSVQRMVRRIDAGGVYAARSTPIEPGETAGSLRARLAAIAAEILPEVLSAIEQGKARARPQDESLVSLAPPLAPHERAIRWSETAEAIVRRVRAFAPEPGAFALLPRELARRRTKVLTAEAVARPPDDPSVGPGQVLAGSRAEGLVVAAGSGAVRLLAVQPEGKRAMDAQAFLSGHALEPGMRLLDGLEPADARASPLG